MIGKNVKYNSQEFTPEEVDKGFHFDLIRLLLNFNKDNEQRYMDIHITSDSYCVIVEWCEVFYEDEDNGMFKYVNSDEVILKEGTFNLKEEKDNE